MTGTFAVVFLSIVVSAFLAAGQLLVKRAVSFSIPGDSLVVLVLTCLKRWEFWAGGSATAVGSTLWLKVLSWADLSFAYPLIGLTFVFVMFGSAMILGERITVTGALGAGLVVAGVVVMALKR
jgi:drug/metabolite transporter (DMT)-like permease